MKFWNMLRFNTLRRESNNNERGELEAARVLPFVMRSMNAWARCCDISASCVCGLIQYIILIYNNIAEESHVNYQT